MGLVAAFLVLLAAVWYLEWRPGRPLPKSTITRVLEVRSADVERVTVTRGERVLDVARQGNDWVIRRPEAQPADRLKMQSLVGALTDLVPTRTLTGIQALDPYGLSKPEITVELEGPAGTVRRLLVGGQTPEKTGYYVKANGSPTVYVVSDDIVKNQLLANLDKPPRATPTPSVSASPSPSPGASR